jgi:hypothetical protein
MSKRIGRWTYFQHPHNGPVWRLDGTTLDLEHDTQSHACCIGGDRCNGAWVLYRDSRYAEPVAEHLESAMEWVERMHDEERLSPVAAETVTCAELAAALTELAKRTGNGNAYFPALAADIFGYVKSRRKSEALDGALLGANEGNGLDTWDF